MSKKTNTEFDTSPVIEALLWYWSHRDRQISSDNSSIFCTYFPSLEEFLAIYFTDIRTVYYMGDVTDERAVRFLNNCPEPFEIISLEVL